MIFRILKQNNKYHLQFKKLLFWFYATEMSYVHGVLGSGHRFPIAFDTESQASSYAKKMEKRK
jgi:hypothetical protein